MLRRLGQELDRSDKVLRPLGVGQRATPQKCLVSLGVDGLSRPPRAVTEEVRTKRRDHGRCDLVLDLEYVCDVPIVRLGPRLKPGCRPHQLHRHADRVAGATYAPREYVRNVQRLGNFRQRDLAVLEIKRRRPARDLQLGLFGKQLEQLLGDTVAEVRLIVTRAQIREWQHRHRPVRGRLVAGGHAKRHADAPGDDGGSDQQQRSDRGDQRPALPRRVVRIARCSRRRGHARRCARSGEQGRNARDECVGRHTPRQGRPLSGAKFLRHVGLCLGSAVDQDRHEERDAD